MATSFPRVSPAMTPTRFPAATLAALTLLARRDTCSLPRVSVEARTGGFQRAVCSWPSSPGSVAPWMPYLTISAWRIAATCAVKFGGSQGAVKMT